MSAGSSTATTAATTMTTEATATVGTSTEATSETGETSETSGTTGVDLCKPSADPGEVVPCVDAAPPDAFVPDLQWSWDGPPGEQSSFASPLVANLTDDNMDGAIDLCDIPDIVILAGGWGQELPASLYVFDGATGTQHHKFGEVLSSSIGPALGDIDGDGIPEILAGKIGGAIVAFEHDGTVKWTSEADPGLLRGNIGLADLDNDGDVEIYGGSKLFDHNGQTLWTTATTLPLYHAVAAADLDGDGDQEIVLGNTVLQHDGSLLFSVDALPGYPQIADFDDDPEPEVLLLNVNGITLYDHDGTVHYDRPGIRRSRSTGCDRRPSTTSTAT